MVLGIISGAKHRFGDLMYLRPPSSGYRWVGGGGLGEPARSLRLGRRGLSGARTWLPSPASRGGQRPLFAQGLHK